MQIPLLITQGSFVFCITLFAVIIGFFYSRIILYSSLLFLLFSFYFFRNPDRINMRAVRNSNLIVAPADGKIVAVTRDTLDAPEYTYRISIFLSLFDVHVNWTPIAGVVEGVAYRPGTFTLAWLDKSAQENERNDVTILSDKGNRIMVRQIAGAVARRINCWVAPNQLLKVGQKIGMIRFGSRVDLFLPENVRILVKEGQCVQGGDTIVAEFTERVI